LTIGQPSSRITTRSSFKIKISLRHASLRTLHPSYATEYTSAGCAARSARHFEAGRVASSPLLFFFFFFFDSTAAGDRQTEGKGLHGVQLID